jgi:hypothetical protein
MYRVQAKSVNAFQSWTNYGTYQTEPIALSNAMRPTERFLLVRVVDTNQNVLWTGAGPGKLAGR